MTGQKETISNPMSASLGCQNSATSPILWPANVTAVVNLASKPTGKGGSGPVPKGMPMSPASCWNCRFVRLCWVNHTRRHARCAFCACSHNSVAPLQHGIAPMIRHLFAGLLVCPLLGLAFSADAAPASRRPNVVFIFTDDHAAHSIGAYGSKINKTPNLDKLAAEGMLFRNCFVTNSICGPCRAVILTGKYSHLNGFPDNGAGTVFDGSQQTFPKLLQRAG